LEIKVNDNDLETALRVLKRKLQRDGLMGELKKRRYYEKPSVKLKTKQREAQKRKARNTRRRMQNRKPAEGQKGIQVKNLS
jgi:small subunit ribosomal protein S21